MTGSDPYRIQTCNLLIRSQMLYSVKLRDLRSQIGCKDRDKIENTKYLTEFFHSKNDSLKICHPRVMPKLHEFAGKRV